MRSLARLLLLPGLLASAACAGDGLDDDDAADDGAGGKADDPTDGPAEPPPLAAAYAVRLDARYDHCPRDLDDADGDGKTAECASGAPTQDSVAVIGLWRPTARGAEVDGPLTLCAASSRTGGNDLSIAPGFLRALPPIALRGALTATDDAIGFASELGVVVLGARLGDALGDELPDAAGDPRVIDHDGDGRPGFSIDTGFGRIFAALRVVFRLEGRRWPGEAFAGGAEIATDQTILGDDIPFFDAASEAAEAAASTLVTGERHSFVLAPLGAGATCDAAARALPVGGAATCEVDGDLGVCVDTTTTACPGDLHGGRCPGAAAIRCCVP